jgi:hypothetical protein
VVEDIHVDASGNISAIEGAGLGLTVDTDLVRSKSVGRLT